MCFPLLCGFGLRALIHLAADPLRPWSSPLSYHVSLHLEDFSRELVQTGGFGALVAGRRMLSLFQYHTPCRRATCYRTGNTAVQATRLWSCHTDHNFFAEGVQKQPRCGKSAAGLQHRTTGLSRPAQRMLSGGLEPYWSWLTQTGCEATQMWRSPKAWSNESPSGPL